MTVRTRQRVRTTIVATLSLLVFHAVAWAQIEAVDTIVDAAARLIHVAKSIKELVLTPTDEAGDKSQAQSFEIVAQDADGKPIDLPADDAQKLFKWTAKDSSGNVVPREGSIERLESTNDKLRKSRNILKLAKDKGSKAVKLEMRMADPYTTYSAASGTAAIAEPTVAVAGAGGLKNMICGHPYWSALGGVAVVGGGIAVAGGSSGDGDGESSASTDGSGSAGTSIGSSSTESSSTSTIDVTGRWVGRNTTSEPPGTEPTVFNIIQTGTSLSGSTLAGPILSGSINGNSITMVFLVADDGWQCTVNGTVSGNSMSGTYVHPQGSGTFSVARN